MNKQLKRREKDILIQLSQVIINNSNDNLIQKATIVEVRLSKDYTNALVFVSVFGNQEQQENVLHELRKASGFLRTQLSKSLEFYKIPKLTFRLDNTIENDKKLDEIFKQINNEK